MQGRALTDNNARVAIVGVALGSHGSSADVNRWNVPLRAYFTYRKVGSPAVAVGMIVGW